MEASTIIRNIFAHNEIVVPTYQRAYSWETPQSKGEGNKHTDVFLKDLEEYIKSKPETPYYFGHFLFEEKNRIFYVVDGQQRLTTIVIFLSALFSKLKSLRNLTDEEEVIFEDMIKRRSIFRFATVDYDNQLFRDYVIDQTKKNKNSLETESSRRIVYAFDFFKNHFNKMDELYLSQMLQSVINSSCTTHQVHNESEAIQMFIFQNNRGKKPSNLEIIKAQFMYNVHLYGKEEKDSLIVEIKNRFEKIYRSISSIEYKIDEDDVLVYTLRVYFNSLKKGQALESINKELSEKDPIPFIKLFTQSLSTSFEHLNTFFGIDEQKNNAIHSLVTLGRIGKAIPFIIKAYTFGHNTDEISKLCVSLESLILRHRLIGTRAEITDRIKDVFENFTEENSDITQIINRINSLKETGDWWWAYWNNKELKRAVQGRIDHTIAIYLLWKYENHLKSLGKSGYAFIRYGDIKNPELEHIAPTTEPGKKDHGYGKYTESFLNEYQNCLGNYLLLSKSHNCSVGNVTFPEKYETYTYLEQQREIQKMIPKNGTWDKDIIKQRKEKIINFILEEL